MRILCSAIADHRPLTRNTSPNLAAQGRHAPELLRKLTHRRCRMRRPLGSAVWAAAAATTAVACSFSAGTSVSFEVGVTTRCMLKDGDDAYGVNVNVTKVEGTNVNFNIKVDDQPQ